MKSKRTVEKAGDKRRLIKYLARSLRVIAGLVILIAIIAHFWLIPAKISSEVKRKLLRFWDGDICVENIKVSYLSPIHIERIRLIDKTGRQCLCAETVNLTLTRWPWAHPRVSGIEIERLNLKIPFADKKFTLPFKCPSEVASGTGKMPTLRRFAVGAAEIAVADATGTEKLYDNLQLLVIQQKDFYDFLMIRLDCPPSEALLIRGKFIPSIFETELLLRAKHTVKSQETALVFAALHIPSLLADGNLAADLTVRGTVKQAAGLKAKGTIAFDGWTVSMNDKVVADNLAAKAVVKDGRFEFENITAAVCRGTANASLCIEISPDGPAVFNSSVLAQRIDFAEFTSLLSGSDGKAAKGLLTFTYNFSGRGADLQKFLGSGQIFLTDADITVIPVIPYLFRVVCLGQFNPLDMSEAGCKFTTAGPVATIEAAHVANRVAAIRAEPSGTVNLHTKQIDLYVVAVPLKQFEAVLGEIPLADIFVNLKDKLVRLRLRGRWSDEPTKLITKEPIKDIGRAATGFFEDIIKTVDWLIQPLRKGLGNFRPAEDNK